MSLVADTRWLAGRLAQLDASPKGPPRTEYRFLLGRFIDAATLAQATATAAKWGVHPHEVLIATGRIKADDYYRALAEACGTPFMRSLSPMEVAPPTASLSPRQCLAHGLLKDRTRARHYIFAPDALSPNALRHVLTQLYPRRFALASPHAVRRAFCHHFAATFAHDAVEALAARFPERSARTRPARWQRRSLGLGVFAILGALLLAPLKTIWVLTLALAIVFLPVILLRLVALYGLMRKDAKRHRPAIPRVADRELPVYTVFVPLYREAHMVPGLIRALTGLDWPAAKLDIKLILEASDQDTVNAAAALALPGNVEIIVVPELHPRTKPKALNYALPLVRGQYLVIYDAEDRPDPDQLRRAFHAFRTGPPNLATVQARLNLYNAQDNWLTRQFTIEYCALFDGLLPALDRLNLPIPLGGSSNHFHVSALTWLMAWDPF
ncbi:MAG: glycosyltransferase, partial [Methyloceanibacter sp.]